MGCDGYDGEYVETAETTDIGEVIDGTNDAYDSTAYEAKADSDENDMSDIESGETGADTNAEGGADVGEGQKYESNSVINEDGERFRTDDNGERYMDYDKEAGKWSLKENTAYEVNGYKYETDDKGRIEHVEGDLYLKDGDRASLNADVEDMEEMDDRGHIIADRFNGSNRIDNLVAQNSEVNRGEYKSLENELAKAVDEGHDVHVEYEVYYDEESESKRPEEITVKYTIDGVTNTRTFEN